MASILLNGLDESGCSSSSLDNCFVAAFWFGRGSGLHALPIAGFHQSQDTSASAHWGPWSEAQAWSTDTDGLLATQEAESTLAYGTVRLFFQILHSVWLQSPGASPQVRPHVWPQRNGSSRYQAVMPNVWPIGGSCRGNDLALAGWFGLEGAIASERILFGRWA